MGTLATARCVLSHSVGAGVELCGVGTQSPGLRPLGRPLCSFPLGASRGRVGDPTDGRPKGPHPSLHHPRPYGDVPLQEWRPFYRIERNSRMNIDDDESDTPTVIGSDELLSDDNLRLPESANVLVRLHAVRAWLARRYDETSIEVGEAALELQQAMSPELQETRPRRRERQGQSDRVLRAQQTLLEAQERLQAYGEAQALLEDCVAHTNGERVLVDR